MFEDAIEELVGVEKDARSVADRARKARARLQWVHGRGAFGCLDGDVMRALGRYAESEGLDKGEAAGKLVRQALEDEATQRMRTKVSRERAELEAFLDDGDAEPEEP